MHLKDYYGILVLETSATQQEIKKAYRALALQYHPDKKPGDAYAAAQFAEIKEAYEVLTNPSKREYYLQQRWYNQSIGKRKSQDIITPVTVLLQSLELEKYVSALDVFRMDKEGLKDYMLGLLCGSTIEKLNTFRETDTNRQIITTLLRAMHPLPPHYSKVIITRLEQLAAGDDAARQQIQVFVGHIEKKYRREKYSLLIIIAATVLLCLLIFLAGR